MEEIEYADDEWEEWEEEEEEDDDWDDEDEDDDWSSRLIEYLVRSGFNAAPIVRSEFTD